jgi:putative peptidoglycan lipid II flippase
MSQSRSESPDQVLKSAGAMGIATLMSRVMGLVREQVFAYFFGAGNLTDAFQVAFRIPNLLRDLFAEGAMSASLVPTFTRTRIEEGESRAIRVAGLVFRVLFIVVTVLSILGIVFAPELVALYASAFKAVPGKFELTVRMTRMMFPFFPLVALAAAFMGILNAYGVFFLPAFASALFNVTSVIVGVIFSQIFAYWGGKYGILSIEGMAIGVVAGGAVQAFCQLPTLYKKGYRWIPKQIHDPAWYEDPRLKKMLWMMVPGTIGLAATQVNILINTILATSQGTGAVAWLNFAFRLMQFPIGIFGVSLASATLPRISQQWVKNDITGVSQSITQGLRTVFAVNLPASAGLAFLGYPIIQLIFQYGRFYHEDTQATAMALAMYAIGLTAYSAVKVLVPACYALGNTKVPVLSSLLAVAVTIVLNLIMVKSFGYWGLALGTSIAAIINAVYLLISIRAMIRRKNGELALLPLFESFGVYLILSLFMGAISYYSHQLLSHWLSDASFAERFGRVGVIFGRGFRVGVLITEACAIYWGLCTLLKMKEAIAATDLFMGKLKKKLSQKQT